MPTKAQWARYHAERAGPKKAKRPPRPRRDAPVDTSMPGISATHRKAGGGLMARRNFSGRSEANAPYALEDSARGRPSRKSTRKSANRSKPSHPLRQAKKHGLRRDRLRLRAA